MDLALAFEDSQPFKLTVDQYLDMFEQGIIAIHERVLNLSIRNQRVQSLDRYRDLPFLYIRPQIGHLHTFDFDRNQFFMEEGYRAACEAIAKSKAV